MKKTVQSVKNSLKFKARPKSGILSVRIGVKKFVIPVEARLLSDGQFAFLSFSGSSELYRVDAKQLSPMKPNEDASAVHTALSPSKKKTRKRASGVDLPKALADALKSVPAGYKLGYGTDGAPKLVRTRRRRTKKK